MRCCRRPSDSYISGSTNYLGLAVLAADATVRASGSTRPGPEVGWRETEMTLVQIERLVVGTSEGVGVRLVAHPEVRVVVEEEPEDSQPNPFPSRSRSVRSAKKRGEQEELYLSDLVLGAYARHHQGVRDRYSTSGAPGAGLPLRPRRRRRRVADPTQFVLYLSHQELEVFDDLAHECGISRSELVSTLLELESEAVSESEHRHVAGGA